MATASTALKNIISIADHEIKMAIFAKVNGKNCRYNFATRSWDENTELTEDKIISVGEFRYDNELYRTFGNRKLITWSTLKASRCKNLTNLKAKRDIIISLSINA